MVRQSEESKELVVARRYVRSAFPSSLAAAPAAAFSLRPPLLIISAQKNSPGGGRRPPANGRSAARASPMRSLPTASVHWCACTLHSKQHLHRNARNDLTSWQSRVTETRKPPRRRGPGPRRAGYARASVRFLEA
ncbi:hypothetical protein EVAR_82564_1 [Eumeta japonica]|uniref:Uncharacterized protein n=1 Tax=Eumeta variegata TaxID=151549 RepID=A0A4C1UXZ7_EUMVA|nr:hypothetical protein EVAR_82564_1 [Eumeta japonica]